LVRRRPTESISCTFDAQIATRKRGKIYKERYRETEGRQTERGEVREDIRLKKRGVE